MIENRAARDQFVTHPSLPGQNVQEPVETGAQAR
jgi:hypothetical protein